MSFLLLAYDSSIATGSVLVDCKSVVDASVATQSGDGYVIDKRMKFLVGAFGFGANLTRAQIQAPQLNLVAYQEVAPIQNAALTAGQYPQFNDLTQTPRALNETEVLIAQVIQAGGVAENDIVGVWLADGPITPVTKEGFSIRFTGTTTLTAAAWTTVVPTLERTLPKAHYQLVGAHCKSATGVLFRINFPGFGFRPGGLAAVNDQANDYPGQRRGGWGVWGEFDNFLLPTLDVLATGADTAQSGEWDLIKVS